MSSLRCSGLRVQKRVKRKGAIASDQVSIRVYSVPASAMTANRASVHQPIHLVSDRHQHWQSRGALDQLSWKIAALSDCKVGLVRKMVNEFVHHVRRPRQGCHGAGFVGRRGCVLALLMLVALGATVDTHFP